MKEIRCPNCGVVLEEVEAYDIMYSDNVITECCVYQCPQCEKEYQIDLYYKYESYSIEGEN